MVEQALAHLFYFMMGFCIIIFAWKVYSNGRRYHFAVLAGSGIQHFRYCRYHADDECMQLAAKHEDRPSDAYRGIGREHCLRRCGERGAQWRFRSAVRLRGTGIAGTL